MLAAGLLEGKRWLCSLFTVDHLLLQGKTLLIKGIENLLSFLAQRSVLFKVEHVKVMIVLSLVGIVAWRVVLRDFATTISVSSITRVVILS